MSTVRVSLSKKNAEGRRHLILRASASEQRAVMKVVREHILGRDEAGRRITPVVRHKGLDMIVLFSVKYLDRVTMAFPDATLSTGLRKRMVQEALLELQGLPVPEIDIPGFKGSLYDFQKQGVGACVEALTNDGVFMLNDEMGLGKTIQALCVILKMKKKRVLVVTTKSGTGSWQKIIRALFPKVSSIVVEGNNAAQRHAKVKNNPVRVTLVNFEALRGDLLDAQGKPWKATVRGMPNKSQARFHPKNPILFNTRWDMLVVDEFHKCKSMDAQQTKGLLSLPKTSAELFMSGTPFLNNPIELFPTLHRLFPKQFPSLYTFETNLVVKDGGTTAGYDPDKMMELRDWLKAHSMRRRKDQVGIQMPEVIYTQRLVELTAEQRKIYNKIRDEFKMLLESGEVKQIRGNLPQIIRLKQACISPALFGGSNNSAKLLELDDIVAELVANGEKAIIFSQYEEATEIYKERYAAYNPAYVTGAVAGYAKHNGVRMAKRDIQVEKFERDDTCKLYIGTIAANQEAISLGSATYVIFTDKAWTPLANEQAVARSAAGGLRGIGATVPVNVIELFAEDTFEHRIDAILAHKKSLFNSTIEADGGRQVDINRVKGVTVSDVMGAL